MNLDNYAGHGMQLVDRERVKQLEKGYSPSHDNAEHTVGELARIAACYVNFAVGQIEDVAQDEPPFDWPEGTTIPWKPKDEPWETFVMGLTFGTAALDLAIAKSHEGDVTSG